MGKQLLRSAVLIMAGVLTMRWWMSPGADTQGPAEITTSIAERAQEKRYVLENAYQQVVLSNLGGSIAEINLTQRSPHDPSAVVRPVEIDREIARVSPQNSRFPLLPFEAWNQEVEKVETRTEGQLGGYTPLLRRGLLGPRGETDQLLPPHLYATSLRTATEPLVAPFELVALSADRAVFEWKEGDRFIRKTYSLGQSPLDAPYLLKVKIETAGDIGPLWINTGVPEAERYAPQPALQYGINRAGQVVMEPLSLPKKESTISSLYPRWVASSNGFFSAILTPLSEVGPGSRTQEVASSVVPSRLELMDPSSEHTGYQQLIPLSSRPGTTQLALYAGPKDEPTLIAADTAMAQVLGESPEMEQLVKITGFFSFISAPVAKMMWWMMQAFHALTHNWGISLVLMAVCLRVLQWPLHQWSLKTAAKVQKLQPELRALAQKFAQQPQMLMTARAQLFKERGIRPQLPSLVLFLQFPLFIGLWQLLRESFILRGVPFIPGWISNLAAPDVVFSWGFHLPLLGDSLHILPFLAALLQGWHMRSNSPATDPNLAGMDPEMVEKQKKMMLVFLALPVLFLYSAPSGLNIFFLCQTLLAIVQQKWMTRSTVVQVTSDKVIPINRR